MISKFGRKKEFISISLKIPKLDPSVNFYSVSIAFFVSVKLEGPTKNKQILLSGEQTEQKFRNHYFDLAWPHQNDTFNIKIYIYDTYIILTTGIAFMPNDDVIVTKFVEEPHLVSVYV